MFEQIFANTLHCQLDFKNVAKNYSILILIFHRKSQSSQIISQILNIFEDQIKIFFFFDLIDFFLQIPITVPDSLINIHFHLFSSVFFLFHCVVSGEGNVQRSRCWPEQPASGRRSWVARRRRHFFHEECAVVERGDARSATAVSAAGGVLRRRRNGQRRHVRMGTQIDRGQI